MRSWTRHAAVGRLVDGQSQERDADARRAAARPWASCCAAIGIPIAGASELVDNPIKAMRLMGEDLVLYQDLQRPLWPARPALSAPARRSVLWLRGEGRHPLQLPRLADGRERRLRRAAVRRHVQSGLAAAQEMHQPGLSGARTRRTPVGLHGSRARRRNCRYGSRSPGRTGSRRSSPARCRATGSSVRKTRSTPCTSSGCTTTGACASAGRRAPTRHAISSLASTSSNTAFSIGAFAKARPSRIRCGPSAASRCGRTASFSASHFEWRIPVDDENTLNICWFFTRVPAESEPYVQNRVPTWYGPIKDAKGRWISSHIINQDVIAWVGQGTIADRSKELLGSSDRGVAMIRNRFFQDMEAVAQGRDPKGIIRDPETAKRVQLPVATPKTFTAESCRAPSGRRIHISVAAPNAFHGRPGSPARCTTSSRMRWGLTRASAIRASCGLGDAASSSSRWPGRAPRTPWLDKPGQGGLRRCNNPALGRIPIARNPDALQIFFVRLIAKPEPLFRDTR